MSPERETTVSDRSETGLEQLQSRLGYRFQREGILTQSLIHRSCPARLALPAADGTRGAIWHNERMELLGDAVLNLLISHLLYDHFPDAPEGTLSQWRSSLVNTHSLSCISRDLGLGSLIRMGHGEEKSGGRDKPTILADALEALLGAIYLDGGYEAVQEVGERLFRERMAALRPDYAQRDYKSLLQERLQAHGQPLPEYRPVAITGAPHDRRFEIICMLNGLERGCGVGRSKREAEQEAARQALSFLEISPPVPEFSLSQESPGLEAPTS